MSGDSPIGPWCGTAPILATPMDRAPAGSSCPGHWRRRKVGLSCGCGAPYSPCARRPGDRGTWPWPRPATSSRNIAYTLGTEKRTDQAWAALDFGEIFLDTILEPFV